MLQLTDVAKSGLLEMRRRYVYQRSLGHLLERTVMLRFASPVLTLADFINNPQALGLISPNAIAY